jgi:hypothetical protein
MLVGSATTLPLTTRCALSSSTDSPRKAGVLFARASALALLSSLGLSSTAISSSAIYSVAATFSKCATDEIPAMGNIAAECPRSQASTI